jgi:hypothetical protein
MASSVSRRAALGGGLAVLLGGSGTAGWALNRYVIDHAEVTNASEQTSTAIEAVQVSTKATTSTATSYQSDTATISIKTVETGSGSDKVTYYVADITVSDATIVKSAFADDSFGTNIIAYPSVIAEQAGAVLAINGDYYGFRETGIEIRNGIIYRDAGARQGLAFYQDGSMKLYDETATNAKTVARHKVSGRPSRSDPDILRGRQNGLDGIEDVEVDTNFGNHSIQGQQPRTGIGWIERQPPAVRGGRRPQLRL